MNHLAVFPSNTVARWIDAEWLERGRDWGREPPRGAASRYAEGAIMQRDPNARAGLLRYRPFERLLQPRAARKPA